MAAAFNACPTFGKVFVVCPSSHPSYDRLTQLMKADPDGVLRLYTTLASAYSACTSGQDDVILLTAGSTSHALTTGLDWTKSRIHVVGLDGGNHLTDHGAKVEVTGAVDTAYILKNTGTRNSFKNVKFIQSSTHSNAKTVAQFGGEGVVVQNCSFIFGVVNNLGSTASSEVVFGEDSGTFIDCEFGADTLLTSAARPVTLIKEVTANQEFKSNRFRGCTWKVSSSSSTALLLKVNSTADVLFTNLFEDCNFYASVDSAGGAALGNAVASASGLVKGTLSFVRPAAFNCTKFCAGVSDKVQVVGPISDVASGIAVTPA